MKSEFRSKTQAQGRRHIGGYTQSKKSSAEPSLADMVKMPKRLLAAHKTQFEQDATTASATYSLYNCCPQAAFVDRQLEERMSG